MGRLNEKVAVITGGSSGIGKATVELFIKEGARVVFGDILDQQGKEIAEKLGDNASYIHTNVRFESDIKALLDLAVNKYGRIDILYNNAGFGGALGLIENIPTDAFDVTMEVLFRSVFLGIKLVTPIMKEQGSGSIISTSSVAGMHGEGLHIYSSAKAAIIQFTRSVAKELGEYGIRVNCICPGVIATPIFGKAFGLPQDQAERMAEMIKAMPTENQPINRRGIPEDIAKAALWLASEDSGFVTGHALIVDGGLLGGPKYSKSIESYEMIAKTLKLGDLEDIFNKVNERIAESK
ncbi:MAG: glucose 1-dehydrogenase [Candidatus Hodarchaeota archaeon]